MYASRRGFLATLAGGLATWACSAPDPYAGISRYVRYRQGSDVKHGLLDGETIQQIDGDLFGARTPTGNTVELAEVKLLYPVEPTKVLALAGNYRSHIGEEQEVPDHPEPFYKPVTSLQNPGDPIVLPPDSKDVHFEAEFVIVIGREAKEVSEQDAPNYILGYTCGNDVSERNWQNGSQGDNPDMQWWRAKGAETFGPMGPAIAVGLDYEQSKIQLRLNGEVKQEQILSDLIHKPPLVVSFVSQYVTLKPGDVIFTGTPGQTSPIQDGDVVEVEIDGIGVLHNPVVAA